MTVESTQLIYLELIYFTKQTLTLISQAKPLFKDRRKFTLMADPLLEGNYPVKGLYQALAVAAMCIQDEAGTRPLIADVVTALEYLAIRTEEAAAAEMADFE